MDTIGLDLHQRESQLCICDEDEKIAVVALARRLAGVLYAMWRDAVPYDASRIRGPRSAAADVTARAG